MLRHFCFALCDVVDGIKIADVQVVNRALNYKNWLCHIKWLIFVDCKCNK